MFNTSNIFKPSPKAGIIISSFPGCGRQYFIQQYCKRYKLIDFNKPSIISELQNSETQIQCIEDIANDIVTTGLTLYNIIIVPPMQIVYDHFAKLNIPLNIIYPTKKLKTVILTRLIDNSIPIPDISDISEKYNTLIDDIDSIDVEKNVSINKIQISKENIFVEDIMMEYLKLLELERENNQNGNNFQTI